MKKEKTIKTYQRRTKTGKVVTVKQHTAKYDAAEALKEAAKKKGAGDELENLKKKVKPEKVKVEKPAEDAPDYGFTADDYKAWYHWDKDADPKNKSALKVEKALKKQMGTKAYKKYFDEMSDSYSSRGHNKAFKGLSEKFSAGDDKKSVTPAKAAKVQKGPGEFVVSNTLTRYKGDPSEYEASLKATKDSKSSGSKKSPLDRNIEKYATTAWVSPEEVRRGMSKIQDRFHRFHLTDNEALTVYKRYIRQTRKPGNSQSIASWLENNRPLDSLGDKLYSRQWSKDF